MSGKSGLDTNAPHPPRTHLLSCSTTIRGTPDSVGVHKVALNPDTDDLPTLIGTLNLNGFGRKASAAAYGGYMYIPTSDNFILKVRCSALRGKTLIRREACTS